MTYKNAKTILFASLIAAMILPFSGMTNALAEEKTENKALNHIRDQLKSTEISSQGFAVDDSLKIKTLKIAEKFLMAKENNDTENILKFSAQLQALIPEGSVESLPEFVIEEDSRISSQGFEITPQTYSYDTFTGNTVYSWDCRDDTDLSGNIYGTITGWTNTIYVVGTYNYPSEETIGDQGLTCETVDFEDGIMVVQELLNPLNGCVQPDYVTSSQTITSSCNKLNLGDLVYIYGVPEYETNRKFSPNVSDDILYLNP